MKHECPHGGDIENNCQDCVYSNEYEWNGKDCVRKINKENHMKVVISNFKEIREELERTGFTTNFVFVKFNNGTQRGIRTHFVFHKEGKKKELITATTSYNGFDLVGKAKCHPDDVFKIGVGIKRAIYDMVKEYLQDLKNEYHKTFEEAISNYEDLCDGLDFIVNKYQLNKISKDGTYKTNRFDFKTKRQRLLKGEE